jgi:phage terminase small subunit
MDYSYRMGRGMSEHDTEETSKRLTPMQRQFVSEYLIDLNAVAAARRAGYTGEYINRTAWELVRRPHVAKAIEEQLAAREHRTRITADRVLAEYAKIAFADLGEIFDDNGELLTIKAMPPDIRAAIASFEIETSDRGEGAVLNIAKIKMLDKLGALGQVGRHLGLFNDKLELSGKVDVANSILAARQRLRKARPEPAPSDEPYDEGDDE